MSGNGIEISTTAYAASHRQRPRTPYSAPARAASASSTAAPSTTRPQASVAGVRPPSTPSLMNRYGIPQRVETAAKIDQARAPTCAEDTWSMDQHELLLMSLGLMK
jgi:hypothetical protein